MKNYYNKQRESTTAQIKYLYETKDVTFRGVRFSGGQVKENVLSDAFKKSANGKSVNGSKTNDNGELNLDSLQNCIETAGDKLGC